MKKQKKRVSDDIVCGVYEIKNIKNGKRYIGSSKDIYRRWLDHQSALKRNGHHSSHLQSSWNKYGEDVFAFSIVEECGLDERFDYEQKWMDYYKTYDPQYGYNESSISKCPDGSKPISVDDIKNGKSIMTIEEFQTVLSYLINTDISIPKIAKIVNVPQSTIYSIYFHDEYSAITKNLVFRKRVNKAMAKISPDDVKDIVRRLQNFEIPADIAKLYNVQPNVIYDIRSHNTWKEYTDGISFPEISGVHRPSKFRKTVLQYDCLGNILNEYESLTKAGEITKVSFKDISACCHGKTPQAGGYVWRFIGDNFDKYKLPRPNSKEKKG